jgi:uncharacterized OB-fold protein
MKEDLDVRGSSGEAYAKPLPSPDPETRRFWDALREHKLLFQKCQGCGTHFAPYQAICPKCWSDDVMDYKASGRGTVYTFSIVYRAPTPAFKPDLPYVVAIVELDEGVYFTTNLVGCPIDEVFIGMEVEVVFEDATEAFTLAKFRPLKSASEHG